MIDKLDLSVKAAMLRRKLGADESAPLDIFALAQTIDNLTLVFYPLGKTLSGACFKSRISAVITINTDMSFGRQRFTLAHEFYHLFYDETGVSTVCSSKASNENERCADTFASYFLMPPSSLEDAVQKRRRNNESPLSSEDVICLEQYFGVSHYAMLVRLADDGKISGNDIASMQAGVISSAARLGYDTSLYKPNAGKMQVLGYYIRQAERLYREDIISEGKYEELLLDAACDELVFGNDEGGDGIVG